MAARKAAEVAADVAVFNATRCALKLTLTLSMSLSLVVHGLAANFSVYKNCFASQSAVLSIAQGCIAGNDILTLQVHSP